MAAVANQHSFYSGGYENPRELNYICSIGNLPSILEEGILSRRRAYRLGLVETDPSDSEVQRRRANVTPPNQIREEKNKRKISLHRYVNLYFQPYNPTLYRFIQDAGVEEVCILRVHSKLLSRDEALIADRNASTDRAGFHASKNFTFDQKSSKILHLARSKLAQWFLKEQGIELGEKNADQIRQAELLVPHKIPPTYIKGIYVVSERVKKLISQHFDRVDKITVHPSLFYQDGRKWNELDPVKSPDLSDTGVETYSIASTESDTDSSSWMETDEE